MIGSSVTDPHWLEEVSADRPTLVVAEGLMMYLTEDDVRRLFVGIVDRFPSGLLSFDAISSLGLRLQRFNRAVQAAEPNSPGACRTPGRSNARIVGSSSSPHCPLSICPESTGCPAATRSWSGR
jgi:O-methyltransferase involved in polyketide biosynthesis